jgi:hypothetical protein
LQTPRGRMASSRRRAPSCSPPGPYRT